MAFKAKDGSNFTNRPMMLKHDSQTASKAAPALGVVAGGEPDADDQDITQDPEAMKALDYLSQKGYSIEQITVAYQSLQGGTGEPDADQGAPPAMGMGQ